MKLNSAGFSLIEVLSVLGIVLILLGAVLSFFISSQKTFASGSNQVELHSALRMAAEKINREIRYAHDVKLLDDPAWVSGLADTSNWSYVFLDPVSRKIVLLNEEGEFPLSEAVVSGITFSGKGGTLLYTLHGEKGAATFALESSVKPLNSTGTIFIPDEIYALRIARNVAGALKMPDEDSEGEGQDDSEPFSWSLNVPANYFPKSSSDTDTKKSLTWERVFLKEITQLKFFIPRAIEGETYNSSFSGFLKVTYSFGGNEYVIMNEQILQPVGAEIIEYTSANVPIPAQKITVKLEIKYNPGKSTVRGKTNSIEPIINTIQVTGTNIP